MNKPSEPSLSYIRAHAIVWRVTAVAWSLLIFDLSTATFSGSFTAWLLEGILTILHVAVSPATFDVLHVLLRKLAHITEYAILSVLLYGTLKAACPFAWRPRRAMWCILASALYALTDEFHQIFVPGRTASLIDCGFDTLGACLGMVLVYVDSRFHGKYLSSSVPTVGARARES